MTLEEYRDSLIKLRQKFLKEESTLGTASSSSAYSKVIDEILDFINERAHNRISEIRNTKIENPIRIGDSFDLRENIIRNNRNETSVEENLPSYIKETFNREKLLALIDDEIFLSSPIKEKKELAIRKIIEARNLNNEFSYELAKIFCGDNPNFLYRSSSNITSFFKEAGFNFVHDGSTRSRWIEGKIKEISAKDIYGKCFTRLFKTRDFEALSKNLNKSFDDCVTIAKYEIKNLLDKSLTWDNTIDFSDVIGLNVKTDLLFNKKSKTTDITLNDLIDSSKDFFVQGDYQTAIEKLWDALERCKTLLDNDKKKSVKMIIEKLSGEMEYSFFDNELKTLTDIGNKYQIRHFEKDKKPIEDFMTKEYLYFRLLSLIDFILSKIS